MSPVARLTATLGDQSVRPISPKRVQQPINLPALQPHQRRGVLNARPAIRQIDVAFLESAPAGDLNASISGRIAGEITAGARNVYIHYPQGQGASKMKFLAPVRRGT